MIQCTIWRRRSRIRDSFNLHHGYFPLSFCQIQTTPVTQSLITELYRTVSNNVYYNLRVYAYIS